MTTRARVLSYNYDWFMTTFGAPTYPYTCREYTPEFFDPNIAQMHQPINNTMCAPVAFDLDLDLTEQMMYRPRTRDVPLRGPAPMLHQPERTWCSPRRFRNRVNQSGQGALRRTLKIVAKRQEEQPVTAVSLF